MTSNYAKIEFKNSDGSLLVENDETVPQTFKAQQPKFADHGDRLLQPFPGSNMDCQTDDPVWFALRVRSNFEKKSGDLLAYKGYQVFSPMYRRSRRDRSGVKESIHPLFPGYIFCSFDPYDRLPILTTPGIVHIVGIGKSPLPVDSQELNNIRAVVSEGEGVCPRTYLSAGQTIRIERGPLAGIEGILEEFRNCYRVVVSITLLQRSITAEVKAAWLQPIRRFCALPSSRLLFDGSAPGARGVEDPV